MSARSSVSQGVVILGSTGSIGVNALDVIARHPDRFHVTALTANRQVDVIFEQCRLFRPSLVAMFDAAAADELDKRLRSAGLATDVRSGADGIAAAAAHQQATIVVAAIVGAAGLLPTLAAVRAGKRVLLANKEPLVIAGRLLLEQARSAGGMLLPVDSEHNAIFQCLPSSFTNGECAPGLRRIFLTCSGGPFRTMAQEQLSQVTPEQAYTHPKWNMGRKISVDSATLMNKGLELIEACRLFGIGPERVNVVIHPQSVIHSMVEYIDGSVLAQLANPDMRIPLAHALAWPERIESGAKPLDLFEIAQLEFSPPDVERFPCLRIAYEAAAVDGTAPAVLNAANEVAVAAFLDRTIAFTDIPRVIEHALSEVSRHADDTLESILLDDKRAREAANDYVARLTPRRQRGAL